MADGVVTMLSISFVYYGFIFSSAYLKGGPYLNLTLSGLTEFPSFLLCALTLNRLGRRNITSAFLLTGGVCSIVATFLQQDHDIAKLILSLLGKTCISGSFCTIYVFAVELFPTVARNLMLGTGSTFARIGSIIAPFILLLGNYWMLGFGLVAMLAGLCTLMLPETMNQKLPDTMDEGEQFGMNKMNKLCSLCIKKEDTCP